MLNIRNLNISIDDKEILKDINLNINDGEIHVLMGPNGVGKSSISKVITGDHSYNVTGSIKYNDEELLEKDITSIARLGIYKVDQNPIQIEGVTNAEMLRVAIGEKTQKNVSIFEFNKELSSICEKLKLDKSFIHKNINEGCSGGERKKIELMHLWMLKPKFIILDEIDSGLDVDAINTVVENIKEYYELYKPSILIITHEDRLINNLNNFFVHVMCNKKIVKSGSKDIAYDVLNNGFNAYYQANEVVKSE